LDEAHVGKAVNAYLKDEFMFDAHPPLGKLILAGVSSLSKYNGSFAFDEIGEYVEF
jgi:dolichyl-phosphate-mannose-protein mannosyltransferase